jgi:BlaI family transcriptional regulator, penicillinase repressor
MDKTAGLPTPTPAELEILQVLWSRGPSTVREVHEQLSASRHTRYTTSLKLLQIMAEKGLVARDESSRAHCYSPRLGRADLQRRMVDDLVDRAFGGAAQKLVLHALGSHRASPEELAEIRRLLDSMEGHDR